jgi:hypothetical protein
MQSPNDSRTEPYPLNSSRVVDAVDVDDNGTIKVRGNDFLSNTPQHTRSMTFTPIKQRIGNINNWVALVGYKPRQGGDNPTELSRWSNHVRDYLVEILEHFHQGDHAEKVRILNHLEKPHQRNFNYSVMDSSMGKQIGSIDHIQQHHNDGSISLLGEHITTTSIGSRTSRNSIILLQESSAGIQEDTDLNNDPWKKSVVESAHEILRQYNSRLSEPITLVIDGNEINEDQTSSCCFPFMHSKLFWGGVGVLIACVGGALCGVGCSDAPEKIFHASSQPFKIAGGSIAAVGFLLLLGVGAYAYFQRNRQNDFDAISEEKVDENSPLFG